MRGASGDEVRDVVAIVGRERGAIGDGVSEYGSGVRFGGYVFGGLSWRGLRGKRLSM